MMKRYKPYFNEDITIPNNFKLIKNTNFNKSKNKLVFHISNKKYIKSILLDGLIAGHSRGFYKKSISKDSVWFWNNNNFEDIFIKFNNENNNKECIIIFSLDGLDFKLSTGTNSGYVDNEIPLENIYGAVYLKRQSLTEDIVIPLEPGDTFLYGRFKNKTAIYDSHYINNKGDLVIKTDMGKEIPACKIRLVTEESKNYKKILDTVIKKYVKKQNDNEFITGDCANFAEGLIRFISEWFDMYNVDYYFVTLYTDEINHTLIYFDGSYFDAGGIGSKKEIESRLGINKAVWKKGDEGRYNPSGVHYSKIEKGLEIEYKKINKFSENLRIPDLQKHAGTSDFTKDWVEIRRKILGTGAKTVKLKSMKVNRKKDYITFLFKSFPTYDKIVKAVDFPDTNKDKPVKMYTQQIMILDFFKLAETKPGYNEKELSRKEIKEILNVADVKVSCDCKSFQFQGMNHILTTFDASIYPELRPPKVWNKWHKDDSFTCKHLDMLLTQGLNIYLNNMASMINKYLKK